MCAHDKISCDGIMASSIQVWAHPTWRFIHSLPNIQGPDARDKIATVFCQLVSAIPCPHCKKHAEAWIAHHSPYSVEHRAMAKYFSDFHNSINVRLRKPLKHLSGSRPNRLQPRSLYEPMRRGISFFSNRSFNPSSKLESVRSLI